MSRPTPHDYVFEFHSTYEMPIGTCPQILNVEREVLRLNLIHEEYNELLEACGTEDDKDFGFSKYAPTDMISVADALADLVYVAYGMAIEMGINLDRVLEEVQVSNMSKLMPDGSVKYREDGKVLKGPNFVEPNIRRAVEKGL